MIPYVLHVALLMTVCWLFYKLLLQKETFYQLNRMVLLACLALVFVLPLIRVPQQWAMRNSEPLSVGATKLDLNKLKVSPQADVKTAVPAVSALVKTNEPQIPLTDRLIKWAFYFYWCGVAAFGLNFLLQVIVLVRQAYKNPYIRDGQFRIVELDGDKAPCSFGNYIFINPAKYDWDTYSQILLHEKIHIKQGHSFDLLLAELVLVFQWFNPFAWLYRKEVENNLEFLTDSEVLNNKDVERETYQLSLLKVSVPHLSLRITTNYNQSLLKKRIVMMNAKKSNIHTMWKYFFMVPLMGFLVCALNQPVAALSQSVSTINSDNGDDNRNEGNWTGTIKGNYIDLKLTSEDNSSNTSMGENFLLSELSALPKGQTGEFKLTREAGTMFFTGRFDGNTGKGKYKFVANPQFNTYLKSQGITNIAKYDPLAFFAINLNRAYVNMLHNNGYKNISKDDLVATKALKVDEPYIKSLKQNGFPNITLQELITGKAMGINGAFISEIRKAGYPKVSFEKLVSFKAQGIGGQYIANFKKARGGAVAQKKGGANKNNDDTEDNMIAFKALSVDDAYVNGLKKAGYSNLSSDDLIGMKAVGVTPEFIQSFKDAGYSIPKQDLVSLKALGITPAYLNGFKNAGFKDISIDKASGLKALGVTPEFIKGFKAIGFDDITLDQATSLKAVGVTPEYITEMKGKGFKSLDINKYITLKSAF
ncbi:M56 family metallopeptidase [Mucilaginibacter sp.]|jgi:hypothetical protein|uniref:M56 family metallopeptidase n=1 Tax=Mucilaginibacter sp. TaxID=1882438 RepID=UPI003569D6C5